MPVFILDEDETDIMDLLFHDTDIAAGIVGGAFVEARLEDRLKLMMRDDRTKDDTKIIADTFQGLGPLASFSTKVRMGYLLRLYGRIARKELETIKDIRNAFAHSRRKIGFETQRIAAKCENLKLVENYFRPMSEKPEGTLPTGVAYLADPRSEFGTPRRRFIATVGLYVTQFRLHPRFAQPIFGDEPIP